MAGRPSDGRQTPIRAACRTATSVAPVVQWRACRTVPVSSAWDVLGLAVVLQEVSPSQRPMPSSRRDVGSVELASRGWRDISRNPGGSLLQGSCALPLVRLPFTRIERSDTIRQHTVNIVEFLGQPRMLVWPMLFVLGINFVHISRNPTVKTGW